MARTYKSEGKQLAYVLKGLFLIAGLAAYFLFPSLNWGYSIAIILGSFIVADVIGTLWTAKRRRKKKKPSKNNARTGSRRSSNEVRSDETILSSRLEDLSGAEFERLLALYFRDQGYTVKEVGVGGRDGGVDLVITDRRGEKTAVQAKCYADHNMVQVMTVRELVGAKRNHDCILSLLITTSDLTAPAKKEAEQFKVDYWHGGLLEQKLNAWGKWKPVKKRRPTASKEAALSEMTKAKREAAATKSTTTRATTNTATTTCKCGAPMVLRKNKQGGEFWGCSTYPKCRHTQNA